jgi:hypothetical protein
MKNKLESGKFYKLTKDDGFKVGTIVLLGDITTMEFFDITTELSTGHSYSSYTIDVNSIEELSEDTETKVRSLFNNCNYEISNDILHY